MRVRTDDLLTETRALVASLEALLGGPGRAAALEVWSIYAQTEKTVAVLKFRMGVERPGLRLEIPRVQASEDLLRRALTSMREAAVQLEREELPQALSSLRMSRNGLRAFLADTKRADRRTRSDGNRTLAAGVTWTASQRR